MPRTPPLFPAPRALPGPRRPPAGLRLALCLCLAACAAPPLAQPAELAAGRPVPHEVRRRLACDDVVRVEIFDHPELSTGELGRRIDFDGNLDLPLLGPVAIVGLTVTEAREALRAGAERYVKQPSVSLTVVDYAPRLVYVLGEVVATGAYELDAPTTALQALTKAGGLTRLADREEVVLLRVTGNELAVHVFDAATPDARGLFPVEAGDLIFVRESGAGTFQQQIMPYLQGIAPPFTAAASMFLVASEVGE
jgi:protein involved in polysaccharide export with SLBB domain